MYLEIKKESTDDCDVLYLHGEIDAYTAPKLKKSLLPLLDKQHNDVIVDLTDVQYVDSTGLGIFIGALKTGQKKGSLLKLTGLNHRVKRVFSITGLDEVIDIDEGEREGAKR